MPWLHAGSELADPLQEAPSQQVRRAGEVAVAESLAVSTGQRNASASTSEGVLKPRLSRATVELGGDRIQRSLVDLAEVGAPGQVLAEQAVGVLVGAPLPGAAWVAEVDLDTGVDGELLVFGHLAAVIPGQRVSHLLGQPLDGSCQRRAHPLGGEPVRQREQQDIAAVALHQRPDRAGPPAEYQVAFSVAGHRPVGRLSGSLADVNEGVRDAGCVRWVETGPLEGSHAFQEVQSHLVPPVGRTPRVSRVQNAGVAPSHL
jgi:hypothetical protein